jgi:hypothetical protein
MAFFRQDNNQTPQKKLMIIIAVVVFLFFLILWSFWWARKKPVIAAFLSETIISLQNHLSSFNDEFDPPVSEKTHMPSEDNDKVYQTDGTKDTLNSIEFDSTYYYFLWDKLIQEFEMNELDSLTIDSLVKIEMQNSVAIDTEKTNTNEETYILKKDELIYVTSRKPILSPAGTFNSQDSLEFSNVQHNQFTIEFWKSPVNYEGIKNIANSVVIYGMSDFENISINFLSKNTYCLKISNKRYALKNDGKFYHFRELLIQ